MTHTLAKAAAAIGETEKSLRALMQASIDAGNYEEVTVLARWAEQLASIPNGRGSSLPSLGAVEQIGARSSPPPRTRAGAPKLLKAVKRTKPKKRYPVFERAGDQLVKIGWSKASRDEYQHRSPKSVALALLQNMQRLSRDQELLTMENALPLQLAGDELEVPPYQSYLSLAWLRSIGAVKQHGRRGYSVIENGDAAAFVDRAWDELPRYGR